MVYSCWELRLKTVSFVFRKLNSLFFEDFSTIDNQGCAAVRGYDYIVKNLSILFFPATENLAKGSVELGFKSFQTCYKVRLE